MKTKFSVISILIVTALLASACSAFPSMSIVTKPVVTQPTTPPALPTAPGAPAAPAAQAPANPAPTGPAQNTAVPLPLPSGATAGELAAMQGTLEAIYANVNPSVVNIQVSGSNLGGQSQPNLPLPFGNQPSAPQVQQALGSGFVYDNNGDIVTNNHVVNGADSVTVTFSDGRVFPAKVVGKDPDADLAVINVANAGPLTPLQLTNSDQVKVGELAVAIGNPFGLSGTMTVGFISALGRSLPANETQPAGTAGYTIPDVIQTDAAINPGNSGGVLVNDQGQVIGVTAAIESSTRSSSGIGFVIPANIVNRVVPELIKNGKFDHPYLGISGTDLTPQLAKAMNLSQSQRGALVVSVASGGPSDSAGLKGSDKTVQIDGQDTQVGGDVIVAIDGQKVNTFDDLVSYLFKSGAIGQSVKLDIIRGGSSQSVNVVLAARPATTPAQQQANNNNNNNNNQNSTPRPGSPRFTLGIAGLNLDSTLAQAMNLNQNQQGVLVENVQNGSLAASAGLKASTQPFTYQGQQVMIGGDVITAANGSPVTSVQNLRTVLSSAKAGDTLHLTVLRDGKQLTVDVVLPTN